MAGILAIACQGPTRPGPVAVPATPSPPVTNGLLTGLAGSYSLTIDIPDACAQLPEAERRRTYYATLESTPYPYLVIRVAGEGYALPTLTGELWNNGESGVALDWNNFDIGGCDGREESLPDGGTLMICGNGVGMVDGTTIEGNLFGQVRLGPPGGAQVTCQATFPIIFRRAAVGATSR